MDGGDLIHPIQLAFTPDIQFWCQHCGEYRLGGGEHGELSRFDGFRGGELDPAALWWGGGRFIHAMRIPSPDSWSITNVGQGPSNFRGLSQEAAVVTSFR